MDKSPDIHRMVCEQVHFFPKSSFLYRFTPFRIQRLFRLYLLAKSMKFKENSDLSTEFSTFTITTIFIYTSFVNQQKNPKPVDWWKIPWKTKLENTNQARPHQTPRRLHEAFVGWALRAHPLSHMFRVGKNLAHPTVLKTSGFVQSPCMSPALTCLFFN